MNYRKHYDLLIIKAKGRKKPEGYVEIHHIVPKSEGGTDESSNLVFLTAREHFLAHWLLYRENPTQARSFAFYSMHVFHKKSSKEYQNLKERVKREQCMRFGEPIVQVTANGEIVAEYQSAVVAKKVNNYRNSVNQAANGKLASAYGFIWIWKRDLHLLQEKVENYLKVRNITGTVKPSELTLQKRAEGRSKPVLQYSLDGVFLKEWKSSTEVKRVLDLSIVPHLKGAAKTAGGFIWKYKDSKLKEEYDKGCAEGSCACKRAQTRQDNQAG